MVSRIWNESEILVDRKSKFQARCCQLSSEAEIPGILRDLVDDNKSIQKASHMHMYAWRTGELVSGVGTNVGIVKGKVGGKHKAKAKAKTKTKTKTKAETVTDGTKLGSFKQVVKNLRQGSADCGEAGAGQRLLTLLERTNVVNVLLIVTRWHGGIPLGSARFRHISFVAMESLKRGHFLQN